MLLSNSKILKRYSFEGVFTKVVTFFFFFFLVLVFSKLLNSGDSLNFWKNKPGYSLIVFRTFSKLCHFLFCEAFYFSSAFFVCFVIVFVFWSAE